jgi:hypothetical protein
MKGELGVRNFVGNEAERPLQTETCYNLLLSHYYKAIL